MNINNDLIVNLQDHRVKTNIFLKQGDTARGYIVQFTDGKSTMNLEDVTITATLIKADYTECRLNLTIDSKDKSKANLLFTNQAVAVPGISRLEFKLIKSTEILTSFPIIVTVVHSISDDNAIISQNEFNDFEKALTQLNEYNTFFKDSVGKLDQTYMAKLNKLELGINYFVNVSQFGAKGDGVTDDTKSIQDAINSIKGGTVYFPTGTFIISSPIILKRGIYLKGQGTDQTDTVIKKKDGANCKMLVTEFANDPSIGITKSHYFGIDNIEFDGNKSTQTKDAIAIDFQSAFVTCYLTNTMIRNNRGTALNLANGTDLLIDHMWIIDTDLCDTGSNYAVTIDENIADGQMSANLYLNHFYLERTSNKVGGNPNTTPADRGKAICVGGACSLKINELHLEGCSDFLTVLSSQCGLIQIDTLHALYSGTEDEESAFVRFKKRVWGFQLGGTRNYDCRWKYIIFNELSNENPSIPTIPVTYGPIFPSISFILNAYDNGFISNSPKFYGGMTIFSEGRICLNIGAENGQDNGYYEFEKNGSSLKIWSNIRESRKLMFQVDDPNDLGSAAIYTPQPIYLAERDSAAYLGKGAIYRRGSYLINTYPDSTERLINTTKFLQEETISNDSFDHEGQFVIDYATDKIYVGTRTGYIEITKNIKLSTSLPTPTEQLRGTVMLIEENNSDTQYICVKSYGTYVWKKYTLTN